MTKTTGNFDDNAFESVGLLNSQFNKFAELVSKNYSSLEL